MGDGLNFDPAKLALWFAAFLLSVTSHEAAHALAARWGGDRTAEDQVTLNPLPHMRREPFGMLIVPLLSYLTQGFMIGWASAPYDPAWASRHPRRAGLMAAAGPLANLLLAALAIVAIKVLVGAGWGDPPARATFEHLVEPRAGAALAPLGDLLSILVMLNALLGTFNLLPLPPLDGAAIAEGLGGRVAATAMGALRSLPMAGLIGLIIAWQVFGLIAPALFGGVLALIHPGLY
ncbi:MAG: site-2 protease family protein [Acidobacteria bacterium]|nr:site-2 protease family protein [Acidobacteriota bacterium]